MDPDTPLEARFRSLTQPLSAAEVGARLSLTGAFIRRRIREGKLIAGADGKVRGSDLAAYVKARRRNAE